MRLHKLDLRPLFKKRLCFVIPMKLLANGTERSLDRGNCDKTELVFYIAIVIMFAWLIPLIFVHITYYLSFVSYFYPIQKIRKQSRKVNYHIYRHCDLNVVWFYWKMCAIKIITSDRWKPTTARIKKGSEKFTRRVFGRKRP